MLPGGTPSPTFDWRRAALPILTRFSARNIDEGRVFAKDDTSYSDSDDDVFGGAIAQLQATAVLTSLSFAGVTLPMSGVGATPVVLITPTDIPGVLSLTVALQPLPSGALHGWTEKVKSKVVSADVSDTLNETASWSAFVTIQVDQSL
jgi:hypothetical protein